MKIALRAETLAGAAPLRLLHLSDLHLRWRGRVLDLIEPLLDQFQPHALALTGDYFDTPRGAQRFLAFAARVSQRIPLYWTAGNHDRWYGRPYLRRLRHLPGCFCVDDQTWHHPTGPGPAYEFASWAAHVANPASPAQRRIVLLHNPERIAEHQLAGCHLLLAGHLHGAQFIFWAGRDGRYFPGKLLYRWCGDRFQVGQTTLIVSRGLGDTLPLRFRCPKEVVLVEIKESGESR